MVAFGNGRDCQSATLSKGGPRPDLKSSARGQDDLADPVQDQWAAMVQGTAAEASSLTDHQRYCCQGRSWTCQGLLEAFLCSFETRKVLTLRFNFNRHQH